MTDTSSSLIVRVRDRADAASWREFVALYEPLLLAYVRRRGLAEQDARDVVQDAFVRLVRALPTFELDRRRGRFRTWLWTVAASAQADWERRRRIRSRAEGGWHPESAGAEEAEWDSLYYRRVLAFALERVRARTGDKPWACFERHLRQGRPAAEVAAELSLATGTVYAHASRILAEVRKQCAAYLEELGDDAPGLPG